MKVSRKTFARGLLAASAAIAAPARAAAPAVSLFVAAPNLFPENMAYLEATDRFYVGSLRYGRISSVDANGKIATLIDDPRFVSTFGLFTDAARGLLFACNSDAGVSVRSHSSTIGRICGVATIDAKSGRLLRYVDVIGSSPGKHLLNDGALARDGSIFLSDTLSPMVHRITKDGHSELFVSDPRLGTKGGAPGLDGIAIAASGTIVVNCISNGRLFRIDPSTRAVAQISIDGGYVLKGCDGMRFEHDGRLMVTQGTLAGPSRNALVALRSSDNWKTATVACVWPLTATTYQSVRTGHGVYGVQAQVERLFHDAEHARTAGFHITRISA